jgi:hypothetical protein
MKRRSRFFATAAVMLGFTVAVYAQTDPPPKPAKKAPAKTVTLSAKEVQDLKDAISAQQKQIQQQNQMVDQLKSQVQQLVSSTQQANTAAQQAQTGLTQAQSAAAQAQQSASDAQKTAELASNNASEVKTQLAAVSASEQDTHRELTALQALAGRFRFSGDVRVRGEDFFQQNVPDLNRARIRVRFGVDGQLNEDFIAGFAIATGSMGDPTSTNETLTNVFDRKTIALDRGFITFNPVEHPWLSLTGGKFAYTWQRTSATFDPDLNPEGFDEKFSFNLPGAIKNLTAQGMELFYNMNNGKTGELAEASYALGVQVSSRIQYGPWTGTPSILSMKFNRPDAILQETAFATGATTTGYVPTGSTTPVTGIPINGEGQGCSKGLDFPSYAPCAFAPNGMTNATWIDSKGLPHFYSGFNYIDFIMNNQFDDGIARLPLNLMFEFLDNPDAEKHPLSTTGVQLTHLGSQNKEYGFDLSLGQTKNKNDVQFGYAWNREEQDAVIASFVESDQRAPTNILQNRFYALWKLRANTLASFTWWRGRTLNTYLQNNAALYNNYSSTPSIAKAGEQEPYLNRLQFDLIYTF